MRILNKIKLTALFIMLMGIVYAQLPYNDFEIVKSIPVETTLDNPDIRNTFDVWLEMISDAQSTIDIEQFYISNEKSEALEPIIRAIEKAAARGADVRLLCSDWCQKRYEMPYLKKLVALANLDVKLSTIPEWSGAYIPFSRVEHCKMMIIDDSLRWIGSSNWKRDYFYDSRNIAVVIRNTRINTMLSQIFLKSWDGQYSWKIDPEREYKPKYFGEKN